MNSGPHELGHCTLQPNAFTRAVCTAEQLRAPVDNSKTLRGPGDKPTIGSYLGNICREYYSVWRVRQDCDSTPLPGDIIRAVKPGLLPDIEFDKTINALQGNRGFGSGRQPPRSG